MIQAAPSSDEPPGVGVMIGALLEALDGIAYLLAADGTTLAVGPTRWDAFAAANGAPDLTASWMVGRMLLDLVEGDEVRQFYLAQHRAVLGGGKPMVSFEYRCDAPDTRRTMRMSITRLTLPGHEPMVLYQSLLLSAVARPWLSVFEPGRVVGRLEEEPRLPIVAMCGLCQKLAWPLGAKAAAPEWIEADVYYRRGGAPDVRISHGVCPDCADLGADA